MKLLLQGILELVPYGDGTDTRYEARPSPSLNHDVSVWWLIVAPLVIVALCWFLLSVMNKGKASLWKDQDSEMDSSSPNHY